MVWQTSVYSSAVQFHSKRDPSLFVFKAQHQTVHLLVYVDDIIITGSSSVLIQKLTSRLNSSFALKQLGKLDYFLGIEVKTLPDNSLVLTQSKYVIDLLQKTKMTEVQPISSPMTTTCKLSKSGSDLFSDPTLYRSIVGVLQYTTITRPEISFAVNKVCQFMSNPLDTHWTAVKRILRYLKGTPNHGLQLRPAISDQPIPLGGLWNADWASDVDDRRSTSGAAVYLGPNLISWWSRKQQVVARSSTEAEYWSLAQVTAEILWIQTILSELGVSFKTPVVFCDNQSAVALAHNPVLHTKTKHMEIDVFFVRERVLTKQLIVHHIPGLDQWVHASTKPLSPTRFQFLKGKLNVIDTSPKSNHLEFKGGVLECCKGFAVIQLQS